MDAMTERLALFRELLQSVNPYFSLTELDHHYDTISSETGERQGIWSMFFGFSKRAPSGNMTPESLLRGHVEPTPALFVFTNTLGFEGVVVSDWWALGGGPNNPGRMTGITSEGVDLGEQTIGWLYNDALANGVDMFGSGSMIRDYSNLGSYPSNNYPQAIIDGLATGEVEKANVDTAATRILRFKFNKGLFENPYRDVQVSYSQGADHGSTEGGFVTTTSPWVYVDLLYGDKTPVVSS